MSELNPQIKEISVGTRALRKVTIYPLSMSDQFDMTEVVVEAFQQFSSVDMDSAADMEVVSSMMSLIEDNLEKIIKLVTSEDEDIKFSELTNDQFSELVVSIFEVNYESSIKKFQTLFGKVKAMMTVPTEVAKMKKVLPQTK